MSDMPKIRLDKVAIHRQRYCNSKGNYYSVARLIDAAKGLKVFDCPLAAIDLSAKIWSDCNILEQAIQETEQ